MAERYDVVVIGSGPGGARAARRCAQKGAKVAMIEKEYVGGTCLNWGCIPSKVLLASAHLLLSAKEAGELGVKISSAEPDWPKIQQRTKQIVENFRKGMTQTMKNNKVAIIEGTAFAKSPNKVIVQQGKEKLDIETNKLIIATGSQTIQIPAFVFDGQTIISSKEALFLDEVPKSMAIIGGGFIGCEIGCAYAAAGSKVTIIEALDRLLPREDAWVGKLLAREFKKLNIDILTSQKVTAVEKTNTTAKVKLENGTEVEAQKVLVAVGRKAICDKQTVEALGLEMAGDVIKVNSKFETNVPDVYALGDVIGTTYLAHGATSEAEVAAVNVTGGIEKMYDYSLIPRVIFTFPEVAAVGKTEQECKTEGLDITVGKAFFRADGRSVAHNELAGEVRAIRDKKTDKILGITMVGARVTELAVLARALIGTQEKISNICFPHPTVSEVVGEAIENAFSTK
jgi:dihydrolipoamide dehydrogenase